MARNLAASSGDGCALTDARPYRPAWAEEAARQHLAEWAGLEFDPQVVRAFLSLAPLSELKSYAVKQESEARSQEPEAKKICNKGLRLIILNSGFWILTPVFYSSLNFLIRSRSVIGLMGFVRCALKPD